MEGCWQHSSEYADMGSLMSHCIGQMTSGTPETVLCMERGA
jgi:hypothetical protein